MAASGGEEKGLGFVGRAKTLLGSRPRRRTSFSNQSDDVFSFTFFPLLPACLPSSDAVQLVQSFFISFILFYSLPFGFSPFLAVGFDKAGGLVQDVILL